MCCALGSGAQTKLFTYQHYGAEDNLSSSNVQAIRQHANGLIYMATQNGVYTYDGYNFQKLKTENLRSNFIRNIGFDGNNLMIVNREEGVFKYDPQTATVSEMKELRFKTVDELVISGDYAYSLTDQISVTAKNIKTNALVNDRIKEKTPENRAFCLYKTADGRVLVGRQNGLYLFKGTEQEKVGELKNLPVFSIAENKDGKLILGSESRILVLTKELRMEKELSPRFKSTARTFLLSGEQKISKLIADKFGRYWFTSYPDNNLYMFENNTVYDVFAIMNISPTLINTVMKDKNENIWVGTFSDGAYFIQNPFFNNVCFTYNESTLSVNEAYPGNNMIVSATNNGLYSYNLGDHSISTIFKPDDIFPEEISNISSVGNSFYYSKRPSFNNNPSSISAEGRTLRFIPIISKFVYPLNEKEAVIADNYATVLKISLTSQKVLDTLCSFADYRTRINTMLVENDKLLIGTSNGLTIVDLKTKAVTPDTIFNYSINHINLINGKTYIAHEGGLSIYEDKKLVTQLGDIPLTAVKKIKFSGDKLWLATLNGLYMCDKDLAPLSVYNKTNGLLSNTINDVVFYKDMVCIATNRGISISSLADIAEHRLVPEPVKISYFEIDETPVYNLRGKIRLGAGQSNFKVHFFSPLFNKPNKQLFRYRLDREKWIYSTNTDINQSSIAGGKHFLEISSSIDNINWSEPVTVELEKEITFSETPWFYISITGAGLVLITLVSYIWIKRVKKKALKRVQEEQQINLLKHQAMNALLSPHFIFNSLTSIQNYINTNNSLMASEYLAKFSRLIRMIIEKASQSQITLKDEITRLSYYLELEKERFKQKFDFEISVEPGLDTAAISIPNMIIQPHAENSIIHGILPKNEHGTLRISFSRSGDNLLIRIEDDGIGLIRAKEHAKSNHKSLGTSTITNILDLNSKLYNKKQSVKMEDKSTLSPPSNGTLITITLEL